MRDRGEASLGTLGSGAAIELFDMELRRVLQNITDPDTPPKAKRQITLKMTIKPNEDRSHGDVEIIATSKLAAAKPFETHFFLGTDGARARAYENNPRQQDLPGVEDGEDGKVINMGGKR